MLWLTEMMRKCGNYLEDFDYRYAEKYLSDVNPEEYVKRIPALKVRREEEFSIQNTRITYNQLIEEIVKDYENVRFTSKIDLEKSIEEPLIQYEETDWEFLIRICSYFNGKLFPNTETGQIEFYFCINEGKEQSLKNVEILENGINKSYGEKPYLLIS